MKRNSTNDPKLSSLMHDSGVAITNLFAGYDKLTKWIADNATAFDEASINTSLPSSIAESQGAQATQLENVIYAFYTKICEEDLPE